MPIPLEEYLEQAERNLKVMSRTASGTLDTSLAKGKSESMAQGITAEKAQDLALRNYRTATQLAFENRNIRFENELTLRQWIENLAAEVNRDILKSGVLIRQGDSSTKPYTLVRDLEYAMQSFYLRLFRQLEWDFEPVRTAAFVEWWIDIRDHFFADGCGKSAKVASGWVLMRADLPLPDYTAGGKIQIAEARKAYYGQCPSTLPHVHTPEEQRAFEQFYQYYQGLFV